MPIYTVYERATNTKVAYSQVYIRHDHTYVRDLSSIIFIQYMYVMHVDTVYHGVEVYMELGVTRLQGCKYVQRGICSGACATSKTGKRHAQMP